MIIKIDDSKTLAEIQQEFNSNFPFLKLEFFSQPHGADEPSLKKEMLKSNVLTGKLQKLKKAGYLEILPSMKVQDLENNLQVQFGLNAQVFRSSGKLWLETSGTDSMTLKDQNNLGKEKSTPLEKQDLTDIDYD